MKNNLCKAEREVLSKHFDEIVTAIQSNVLTITNKCLSSKLITPSTHDRIRSASSNEDKATLLLRAVQDCMKHNGKCYRTFLQILNELLIYEELIESLGETYREIIKSLIDKENVPASHKSQACKQRGKTMRERAAEMPSSREEVRYEVRHEVTKRYMPKLLKTLGTVKLGVVASACREEELISSDAYNEVMGSRKPIKQRAKSLITTASTLDCQKFNTFMKILQRHGSCKQLVQDMQDEIRTTESETSEYVVTHKSRADIPSVTPDSSLSQRGSQPSVDQMDRPIAASDVGGNSDNHRFLIGGMTTCPTSLNPAQPNPQIEREYNLRKEREQTEAQVEDLRQREKKFMKENTELQRTVKKLKADLHGMEEERNHLIAEIDEKDSEIENLKFALKSLDARFSHIEKEKYELRKNLESKIKHLEIAKNKSEKQLTGLTSQVEDLKKNLATSENNTNTLKDELEKTQLELQKAMDRMCEETKTTVEYSSKKLNYVCLAGLCMFICIMAMLWYN